MIHKAEIEKIVEGLGFELVDVELAQQGLMRVYIDHTERPITVDDCEIVSRQLSNWFYVENVDYSRLEVSSPGMDRPLNKVADFIRFSGCEVDIQLLAAFNGRKNYRGVLLPPTRGDEGEYILHLQFNPNPVVTASKNAKGKHVKANQTAKNITSKKPEENLPPSDDVVLSFTLTEIKKARLVPQFDLRSKKNHES